MQPQARQAAVRIPSSSVTLSALGPRPQRIRQHRLRMNAAARYALKCPCSATILKSSNFFRPLPTAAPFVMPQPCLFCDSNSSDVYVGEATNSFRPGEVFRVVESIATPIEELLAESKPLDPALGRSTDSLKSINSRARATHKDARPCILLEKYLRAVLEDIKRPSFFCIAVYPTIPLDDIHVEEEKMPPSTNIHLHTSLPWPPTEKCTPECTRPCDEIHCNQWILAWSFKTERALLGRWLTPQEKRARQSLRSSMRQEHVLHGTHNSHCARSGERTGMVFGETSVAILKEQCKTRRKAWIDLCRADPTFIAKRESQYREWFQEHDAELARRRCLAQSEASTSMRSWRRQPHPASLMAGSLLSQTIPEEDANIFEERKAGTPTGAWITVDTKQIKKTSRLDAYMGGHLYRGPYPNPENRGKRSRASMKSNAPSCKSAAGSQKSTKHAKPFIKIPLSNTFSVLAF
ncbi:hypothetical protein NUW54_g384 [Trametes sanguinea]|uniref:Uncharacterized protein n=1 Tax=Trametes sanguinea TaxID=158606 RepID=A0ACC1QD95_9APHY|nr:hypothetical protein NUW54_g384 [Trametes sanguinea]